MYEKRHRWRKPILILLTVLCFALLTASFGDAAGGVMGAVQRGALEILVPLQEGASKIFKPFRDLSGWASDTVHAKKQLTSMTKERDALRQQVVQNQVAVHENEELRKLVALDRKGVAAYKPITARVVGRSPAVWDSTVNVDKGRRAGVRVDQAVVTGDGLVGKVTEVAPNAAQVRLLSDHSVAVSAKIAANGVRGIVTRGDGDPDDLVLDFLPSGASKVVQGQQVVTAGSQGERLGSLFPPNIPVGSVSRVDLNELEMYQRVHIKPYADMRNLEFVQILTERE